MDTNNLANSCRYSRKTPTKKKSNNKIKIGTPIPVRYYKQLAAQEPDNFLALKFFSNSKE
jgi:hypothetical protein